MINIICYDLNGEPLRRFYQYDVGQKMVLKDLALSPTPVVTLQCDTCVQPEVAAVTVSGNDLLVTISDSLLEAGLPLRGVVYRTVTPDENVIGTIYIPVVQRIPPEKGARLPDLPDTDGTYVLTGFVEDGVKEISWERAT